MFTFVEIEISDLHKDATGYRPKEEFFAKWEASTDEEKQAIWDRLISMLEADI